VVTAAGPALDEEAARWCAVSCRTRRPSAWSPEIAFRAPNGKADYKAHHAAKVLATDNGPITLDKSAR
jgi:hypothetical protein